MFNGGIFARNDETKKVPLSARDSTAQTQASQVSKSKRPVSATPKIRPSTTKYSTKRHRSPSGKTRQTDTVLADLAALDREELISTILSLKKDQHISENTISMLRADIQRMEAEITKQQRRIDKLIAPITTKNGAAIVEMRKEIEKSVLVRQLKAQIQSLRSDIVTKDTELENLKKLQKSTQLMEVTAEKDEYFSEIQRLRQIIQDLHAKLTREKKQRDWDRNVFKNNEADLKKEMAKLAAGYQELLARITTLDREATGTHRSYGNTDASEKSGQKNKGILRSGTSLASKNSTATSGASPRSITRPESAMAARRGQFSSFSGGEDSQTVSSAVTAPRGNPPRFAVGERGEGLYKGRQKWFPCVIRTINQDGTYGLLYDDGDAEDSVPEERFRPFGGKPHSLLPEITEQSQPSQQQQQQQQQQPRDIPGTQPKSSNNNSRPSSQLSNKNTLPQQQQPLDQNTRKDSMTRDKSADELSKNRSDQSLESYVNVDVNINYGPRSSASSAAASARSTPTPQHMDYGKPDHHATEQSVPVVVRVPPKYKVGDTGDGLLRAENKWYACSIGAVNADGTYKLVFDFGETEDHVPEDCFTLAIDSTDVHTSKAFSQGGNTPSFNLWNPLAQSQSQTQVAFAQDISGAQIPRGSFKKIHLPKYKVGDVGEGNYNGDNKWYKCEVVNVHADGRYKLRYEDGDEEDSVPEERFRPETEPDDDRDSDEGEGGDGGDGDDVDGDGDMAARYSGYQSGGNTHMAPREEPSDENKPKLSPRLEAVLDADLNNYFKNLSDSDDGSGSVGPYGFLDAGKAGGSPVMEQGKSPLVSHPPVTAPDFNYAQFLQPGNDDEDDGDDDDDDEGEEGGGDNADYSQDFDED